MKQASPLIAVRNQRIVALRREGKTDKQIATLEGVAVGVVQTTLYAARRYLGVEAVPYVVKHPRSYWLKVARLWRAGKTSSLIASAMEVPLHRGAALVAQARYHLGVKKVPRVGLSRQSEAAFERRQGERRTTPITMCDIDRHFLRRVGPEFIFRDNQDVEEVWVEGADGLKHYKKRLVFKGKLGVPSPRV